MAKTLIASDSFGTTNLIRFADDGTVLDVEKLDTGAPAISSTLSPNGERLFIGTLSVPNATGPNATEAAPTSVQSWNIQSSPAQKLSLLRLNEPARTITVSTQPHQLIASAGNRLLVIDLDDQDMLAQTARGYLDAPAGPIFDVRFRNQEGSYEIGFGIKLGEDGKPLISNSFDLKEVRLMPQSNLAAEDFVSPQRLKQSWTSKPTRTNLGWRWKLYSDDEPRGELPLTLELHGAPTAMATLDAKSDNPNVSRDIVIVGTNGENNIYVYAADKADPPRMLRQFRGHAGTVLALSTSADGRYLASCSSDATIAVWKLDDLFEASETANRWGVDFGIQSGRLIAVAVRDDGPLHFRGVRSGDQLLGIKWSNASGTDVLAEIDPTQMLEKLRTLEFDTQVKFEFTRLGRAMPEFQSFAAWLPIATLFVDTNREWAFWTPAGYYNASINGHQNFGWQINRGINRLPEYFNAAQFKQALERPEVMRRLLETGSLERAMQKTVGAIGPPPGEDAILNQYQNKPRIEWIAPQPGIPLLGDQMNAVAKIYLPIGADLAKLKLFASGVPAVDRSLVSDETLAQERVVTYRWTMRLPKQPQLKLEMIAATEASAMDRVVMDFDHVSDPPIVPPRLHLLAIGVSDYQDRQIQKLDFAARATDVVADLFQSRSTPLYRVTTDQLINSDATRPMWRVFASQAAEAPVQDDFAG